MVFTLIQFIPGANPELRMVSDMLKSADFKTDLSKVIKPQFGGFGVAIGFIVVFSSGHGTFQNLIFPWKITNKMLPHRKTYSANMC